MDNKNFIVLGVIMVIALFGALYLGTTIGTSNQLPTILIAFGLVALGVILKMGSSLWMLMPILWDFAGRILILPLPFSVRNLACLFVIGTMLLMLPLGGVRLRNRFDTLDALVWIAMCGILLVYLLNPVGLRALSSGTVGSRPYFEIGLAFGAYLVLANQAANPTQADGIVKGIVLMAALLMIGSTISYFSPRVGTAMYYLYSDFMPNMETLSNEVNTEGVRRKRFLLPFALPAILYLLAKSRSLTGFVFGKWWHVPVLCLAIAGLLISGFRSAIVQVGLYYIVASYIWHGFRGVMSTLGLVVLGLIAIYAASVVLPLPLSAQRSLSFLPGKWDHEAVVHAEQSSEWRFRMWEDALTTNKVIKNKLLGDGFGYSRSEYDVLINSKYFGRGNLTEQDYLTVTGTLHSGPLSTIRYTGIIGLLLYMSIALLVARRIYKCIRRLDSIPIRVLGIFFGIKWIVHPLFFVFVFGAYDVDMPSLLFAVGALKLIENSEREYSKPATVVQNEEDLGLPKAALVN